MNNNKYGKLASKVYDLDKHIGRSFGDVEFYHHRLKGCEGPILEPAVGNGRVLIPLLEAGLHVVGFDASEDMLTYCRQHCAARGLSPSLTRQTFQDFSYDERFQAIIIPVGSFQLVTDYEEAIAVLKRFHDHLSPNGRLIIDCDPIGSFLGDASSIRSWRTEEGDLITLDAQRVETDFVAQTTVSHLRYDLWSKGQLVQSELEFFSLRWWGVAEMTLALKAVGFAEVTVSGDFDYSRAPRSGDAGINFEARRAG